MYIHGYTWYIPGGYTWYIHGYTTYIHSIGYTWYIGTISMDIRVYSMYIGQDGIYMGYTWHIPCIYQKLGFQMMSLSGRTRSGQSGRALRKTYPRIRDDNIRDHCMTLIDLKRQEKRWTGSEEDHAPFMQPQSISDKIERISSNLRRVLPAATRTQTDFCLYPEPPRNQATLKSSTAQPFSFQLEIARPSGGPARVRVRARSRGRPLPNTNFQLF